MGAETSRKASELNAPPPLEMSAVQLCEKLLKYSDEVARVKDGGGTSSGGGGGGFLIPPLLKIVSEYAACAINGMCCDRTVPGCLARVGSSEDVRRLCGSVNVCRLIIRRSRREG